MKTSIYKSLLAAVVLLLTTSFAQAQEISKEFHKEYDAQKGDILELNNRYGDINIVTVESDKIVVDVVVTLSYPDREKAEKLMSYINISFTEESGKYSVKTTIEEGFNLSGWGRTDKRFNIKYNVSVPSWIDLTVINKYGNVELDKLDGYLNANVQYGNISTGKLTRGNIKPVNTLNVSYGKINITEAGWLDITARYTNDVIVSKAQAVAIDTKYSKIAITEVSSIVIDSKYDKYILGSVNNIIVNSGYSDFEISSVAKKIVIDSNYGSFRTDYVAPGFELIDIDTDYMGVSAIIDKSASYNIEGKVSYGKIEFDEELFNRQKQIINNTSMELEGVVNQQSTGRLGEVVINASYGNVILR